LIVGITFNLTPTSTKVNSVDCVVAASVVVVVVWEYGCWVMTLIVASLPSSVAICGLDRIFVSPTVERISSTEFNVALPVVRETESLPNVFKLAGISTSGVTDNPDLSPTFVIK